MINSSRDPLISSQWSLLSFKAYILLSFYRSVHFSFTYRDLNTHHGDSICKGTHLSEQPQILGYHIKPPTTHPPPQKNVPLIPGMADKFYLNIFLFFPCCIAYSCLPGACKIKFPIYIFEHSKIVREREFLNNCVQALAVCLPACQTVIMSFLTVPISSRTLSPSQSRRTQTNN